MSKEIICKVCGVPQKRITVAHIKTHGITKEQYELMSEFSMEEIEIEPTGNVEVTPAEITKRIFGEQERDVNRPLVEFLNEFGLTEKEARGILKKFTKGEKVDPVVQAKNFSRIGAEGAEKLKDLDKCETTNLHVAETLVNDYGFIVTSLRGAKGNSPKTWFLAKQ